MEVNYPRFKFSSFDLKLIVPIRVNAHKHGQIRDHDHDQERTGRTTWNDVEQRALVRPRHDRRSERLP